MLTHVNIQVTDAIEVSGEMVSTDTSNLVDRKTVQSKEVSKKPLSKKRSKRKARATSVETEKHVVEGVDEDACVKSDSRINDQCSSNVTSDTLPKPVAELDLPDNQEPPEDFSFGDARQQALREEEYVKQYLAKCVLCHSIYDYVAV